MANILDYLPSPIKVIREFQAIATAEDPELADLWRAIADATSDQYIDEATTAGVERWESNLSLAPKPTDTLDDRRLRIKARINEQPPYTHRTLERKLEALCGENGYTLDVDVDGYTVTVRLALTEKIQFDEVEGVLERIVPLNMILDVDLLYNQHLTLAQYTHAHLALFTHEQVRSDPLDEMSYALFEGMTVGDMEGVN